MSIDGPGMLESDLGHDVYREILDQYDSGLEPGAIRERLASIEAGLLDDLDREIFLAVAAKAFWEIGHDQEDLRVRLADLTASGTSASLWEQAAGSAVARARGTVLARLLRQIGSTRTKPRPRKKYRSIARKLFEVGDCLSLELGGEVHKGVVGKISEHRGTCEYAVLVMEKGTDASVDAFANGRYYGRRIPSCASERGFELGPHVIRLDHRMLIQRGNPFVVVGRLPLEPSRFIFGSFGGAVDLGDVVFDFNMTEQNSVGRQNELLPIRDLLADAQGSGEL